ncbi:MAG: hypothetical protein BWK73_26815 [Thiothrix lacustris]|uniref:Uncharacterized protein n=1 Tax=Thiothrix lacustris TaxID=525917 RepID=A0A1Y1QKX9_9GAMM|nr:MAG: hypothetical protein BWK73_26815 [Thiothrix lacustris]
MSLLANIKRWWATQCATSATGMQLAQIIARNNQIETQYRDILTENRRLATALRAIRDHEENVLSGMHEYSPVWALASEALGSLNYGVAHINNRHDKRLASGNRAAAVETLKNGTAKPWHNYRSRG